MTDDPQRVKIDGKRHYKIGSDNYPSVTTITDSYAPKKEAIEAWKARTDNYGWVRDRAGALGTLAHHRILKDYAKGQLEFPSVDMSLVDEDLETDVETCEMLWEKCDFEVADDALIERRVYSHEHGYAGTFDMFTDGTVVDLKTSPQVRDSYLMQVSAYIEAMKELPDMPNPDDAAIIVLCPDPGKNPRMVPKVKRFKKPTLDSWFETFLETLEKFREEHKQ